MGNRFALVRKDRLAEYFGARLLAPLRIDAEIDAGNGSSRKRLCAVLSLDTYCENVSALFMEVADAARLNWETGKWGPESHL